MIFFIYQFQRLYLSYNYIITVLILITKTHNHDYKMQKKPQIEYLRVLWSYTKSATAYQVRARTIQTAIKSFKYFSHCQLCSEYL